VSTRNPYRCRVCNRLGGEDGYCREHRKRKANPYRCRVDGCYNLASADGYCKNCRQKRFGDQTTDLRRKNFFEFHKHYGMKSFVPEKFGIEKDKFGIEEK
jgi:hypothetical protein